MLIKNATIVTMDTNKRVIKDGDIYIEDNKITKIGKNLDVKEVMEKAELAKEDMLARK